MDNNENIIPEGVKKWNWGAFMFNIYWGIGNNVFISLLCLLPLVNIVMIFVLGAKGNEWAWKNNQYRDVEEFKKVQSTWNKAGFVSFIIAIIIIVLYIILASVMGLSFLDNYGDNYYY